jgi:hypothetical protein
MTPELSEVILFIRAKILKLENEATAREQMRDVWASGDSMAWTRASCTLTKADRLQVSERNARIVLKCRKEIELYQAILMRMEVKS